MHSAAAHLLARANRKPPFRDGRRIVLVLPGGIMTRIRGVGALIALDDLGLRFAFDEIHAFSAGVPTAIGFMSGHGRVGASIYWEELAGRKFINYLRAWKIVDIDYLMNIVTNSPKKIDVKAILANPTKLYVRLFDTKRKQVVYIEAHKVPENELLGLMRAAISLPYFHPGSTRIGSGYYSDLSPGEDHLSDHVRRVLANNPTDVVILYNNLRQYENLHKAMSLPDKVLEIVPKTTFELTRFTTNSEKLKDAALEMGQHVLETFGVKGAIDLSY